MQRCYNLASFLFFLSLPLMSCTSLSREPKATTFVYGDDPYIAMENSENPEVMNWIKKHNARTLGLLKTDNRYAELEKSIREVLTSKERIAYPSLFGKNLVRNFWQDQKNQRGIWRQTTLQEFKSRDPKWEIILDFDELGRKENKSWVKKSIKCLPPDYDNCLISLSDGGRDEVVVREFQVSTRSFIKDGFNIPSSKARFHWINKDSIFVGTKFGPDSLTDSGYPREVRIWRRGVPLEEAEMVFKGNKTDVASMGYKTFRTDSESMFIVQSVSRFEEKVFFEKSGEFQEIAFPKESSFQGEFNGYLIVLLRKDWKNPSGTFKAGSLVSFPRNSIAEADFFAKAEVIYQPDQISTLSQSVFTKDFIVINILRNVRSQLFAVKRQNSKWVTETIPYFSDGSIEFLDSNAYNNSLFASYENFHTAEKLYFNSGDLNQNFVKVKEGPSFFDSKEIVVQQLKAVSRDGTKVPYFLVHKKSLKKDGQNATLLYGYGGFESSMTPFYSGVLGRAWLGQGGVYALANIRGGGEFGPLWHSAAIKENRQRSYDDFEAIAKDLIERNITSPRRLGAMGGSNGGLLVGVALTQFPEYFNAIVCQVPLLDMLRYTQMPPGASWIGEYGDPADPEVAKYIAKYSPYQNIRVGTKYPEAFIVTSTADDRVRPGHARKMVARLEELGHPVIYYENIEGGHGGAADIEQEVQRRSMEYLYLYKKLRD